MRGKKLIGVAALVPAVLLGGAGLAAAAAQDAPAKKCEVTVDRSQPSGVYDVTRQEMENGDCICYVYTGPAPQSDTIENSIATLLQTGECPDAQAAPIAGPIAGTSDAPFAKAAIAGVAAVAGIIVAASTGGGGNGDSTGG